MSGVEDKKFRDEFTGMTPELTMTVRDHHGHECKLCAYGNIVDDDEDICWNRPVVLSLAPGNDVDLSRVQTRMLRDHLTTLLDCPELWHDWVVPPPEQAETP